MSRYLRHSDMLVEPKLDFKYYPHLKSFEGFKKNLRVDKKGFVCIGCRGEKNITYVRKDGIRDLKSCPTCKGSGESSEELYKAHYDMLYKVQEDGYKQLKAKYERLQEALNAITDEQYEILQEYFYDAYEEEHKYDRCC